MLDLLDSETDKEYAKALNGISGLEELITKYHPLAKGNEKLVLMEFVLHGLAEHSLLNKSKVEEGISFKDLFNSILKQDMDFDRGVN
jgi:magnesium chelatase subunit I